MKIFPAATLGATFALIVAAAALAQDPAPAMENAPVAADQTGAIPRAALAEGSNSFTEGQARSRIEASGFTHVGKLTLDDRGIWRGQADRGATTVEVGLDFKGNVAALRTLPE